MQLSKLAAALSALLVVGSCSRVFLVKAVAVENLLMFESEDDGVTSDPWCWKDFGIVDERGRPMWLFEVPHGAFQPKEKCGPNFPIRYGQAPPRAMTTVPAQRLAVGQTYVIVGRTGERLEGAFKFERTNLGLRLRNISQSSEAAVSARKSYYASQWGEGR